jgi:hypothetical protein
MATRIGVDVGRCTEIEWFFNSFDDFLLNDIEFFDQQEMGVEKINVEKD